MSSLSTIFGATASVRKTLQECTSVPAAQDDEWLENLLADFNLWSAGAGASALRKASLDHRLESQPEVQDVIISLLCMLRTFVQRYQNDTLDSITRKGQIHGGHESHSSNGRLAGHEAGLRVQNQAISEHQRSAAKVLRQLVRLTIAIREAGAQSSLQKADREFILENHKSLQKHLSLLLLARPSSDGCLSFEKKFGQLTQVQSRLIEANLRRRNRFLYAQRHSEKLAEPQENRPPELPNESKDVEKEHIDKEISHNEMQETIFPSRDGDLGRISKKKAALTDTTASQVHGPIEIPKGPSSKAPTTAVSSTAKALYPRPPLFRPSQTVFKCPCCCKTLPVLPPRGSQWRKHLARDVLPYTCILEDCPRPLDLYATKENWIKHMHDEHRSAEYWICFACRQRKRFNEQVEFINHLETEHRDGIKPDEVATLISDCSRTAPLEIDSCPLCPSPFQGDGEILDHIAEHIHSFSLRSLPWAPADDESYPNEGDTDGTDDYFRHNDYFDTHSWSGSAVNTESSQSEERDTEGLPELDTFEEQDLKELYSLAKNGKLTEKRLDEFLQISEIDAETSQGRTLLVEAVRGGHPSVVELLVRKGAEVNKRGNHGRTPLHLALTTRNNRVKTVEALLSAKADPDSVDEDGNTPLMDAITRRAGLPVVKLLVDAGASTTKKNGLDQSAIDLANGQKDHEIKRAVLPADEHSPGRDEFIDIIVNLVLFILAYANSGIVRGVPKGVVSNLYHIGRNTEPDSETAKKIDNPHTVDDFKKNIDTFVRNESPELSSFFAPGNDFFQEVAEKAVELKDGTNNHLKAPDHISDLTRLALYQPILYCDDSESMETVDVENGPSRLELLRRLVSRISRIATRLVPDSEGVHLRFINRNQSVPGAYDDLSRDQIANRLNFQPHGEAAIGTELRNKILKPFIFDVLERGEMLKRPILVIVITDGHTTGEDPNTFKRAIVECQQALVEKGYEQEACRFLVSCVGKDEEAIDFLDGFGRDIAINRVVHRTLGPLHTGFSDLNRNEAHIEEWLLNVLMSPITGSSRT